MRSIHLRNVILDFALLGRDVSPGICAQIVTIANYQDAREIRGRKRRRRHKSKRRPFIAFVNWSLPDKKQWKARKIALVYN